MYVYSKRNNRKIIHVNQCRYIQNKRKIDLGYFHTKEQGIAEGYRLCKCCTHIGKLFNKQRSELKSFCEEKNYSIFLENDILNVVTPFSKWKMHTIKHSKKIKLYHNNSIYTLYDKSEFIPGYHIQGVFKADLIWILNYIYEHNQYRFENPYESNILKSRKITNNNHRSKSNFNKLKKAENKKQKRKMVKLVYTIIDELEEKKED